MKKLLFIIFSISMMPALAMQPSHEEIKTQFIEAARKGDISKVQLLATNLAPNDQTILVPALVTAAAWRQGTICKYLVSIGADVNGANQTGQLALVEAAYKCDEETCRMLLEAGADANKRDYLGYTTLQLAAQRQTDRVFNLFLNHVNIHDQSMLVSALVTAAAWGNGALCKRLVNLGADANRANRSGQLALVEAAYNCDEETCRMLLAAGADANKTDDLGYTTLQQAAQRQDDRVFNLFLIHVNIHDQAMLVSALVTAAAWGKGTICKRLIELGADVNRANRSGELALIKAAAKRDEQTCKVLVDAQTTRMRKRNPITLLMCLNRLKNTGNVCARLLYRERNTLIRPYLTPRLFKPTGMFRIKDQYGKTAFDHLPVEWLRPEQEVVVLLAPVVPQQRRPVALQQRRPVALQQRSPVVLQNNQLHSDPIDPNNPNSTCSIQ